LLLDKYPYIYYEIYSCAYASLLDIPVLVPNYYVYTIFDVLQVHLDETARLTRASILFIGIVSPPSHTIPRTHNLRLKVRMEICSLRLLHHSNRR